MNTDKVNEIFAKLNKNRENITTERKHKVNILAALRVAKKGSVECKERLAIIEQNNNFYFKTYNGKIPNNVEDSFKISEAEANIIISVIQDFKKYEHYHTNSYSWLVCGCYYKGFDIIEEGLLEV